MCVCVCACVWGGAVYTQDALPAVMGFEGSGVVVQVGPNTKTISVGDHVYARDGAAFNWGSWAEYAVAEEERLLVVSSDCNMELASLMTINPPTAYGLLYGAESGDWVVQVRLCLCWVCVR